jgi:hypothetical protein
MIGTYFLNNLQSNGISLASFLAKVGEAGKLTSMMRKIFSRALSRADLQWRGEVTRLINLEPKE